MKKISLRILVIMALLIAVNFILVRFLGIYINPQARFDLGFLPIAISGMLFGPTASAIVGGLSDFTGAIIFPKGAWIPGLTLDMILAGLVYGLFLNKREDSKSLVLRVFLASFIVEMVINCGLGSFWLAAALTNANIFALKADAISKYFAILPIRALKCSVMVVLNVSILPFLLPQIRKAYNTNILL